MSEDLTPAQRVKNELEMFVSDWGSDFDVRVEPDEYHDGEDEDVFDVTVAHERAGKVHNFRASVSRGDSRRIMMETTEDSWEPLAVDTFWAWLYMDAIWGR